MDFELTEGQKVAMAMVEAFQRSPTPEVAVLTGFAGTGKSTLLKAIASRFGFPKILAPTGKAALRVQEVTGVPASTVHRWLYVPTENQKTGELEFSLKPSGQVDMPQNKLVIVDEASMLGRDLWENLWEMCQLLQLRLLLVGDPFQLAPVEVNKDDGFQSFSALTNIETSHRAHLSEVTRQALDSPILRASMLIRESSSIAPALTLLNRVFGKHFDDKCMEVYRGGGAIIVHKNVTRHRVNSIVRERLGYGPDLVEGEPLLVLRNTYGIDRFNGEILKFQGWKQYEGITQSVVDRWRNTSQQLSFGLATVEGDEVMLSPEQVRGEAQLLGESAIGKASRRYYGDSLHTDERPLYSDDRQYLGPPHLHSNFGYSLTAHKSQGGEWDQTLVLIENSTRPTTYEGRRWLYSAITRAKSTCYISVEA